jgi:hypothetical protein
MFGIGLPEMLVIALLPVLLVVMLVVVLRRR